MPHADRAAFQFDLGAFAQAEKPKEVRDRGAVFAGALGDLFVTEAMVSDKRWNALAISMALRSSR